MVITKKEFSANDANPVILLGKRDGNSDIGYPVLVDSLGRLMVVNDTSGNVTATTNGSITVGSASTLVLSARTDRIAAIIVNDSNEIIYLALGATATLNSGVRLNPAGGALVESEYVGVISAICSSGGKNLTVNDK